MYNPDQSFLSLLQVLTVPQAPNFLFLNVGSFAMSHSESVLLAIQKLKFSMDTKNDILAAYVEEDVQHAPYPP